MKLIIFITSLLLSLNAYSFQPTKPVTVVIGYASGSGNEIVFRKAASIVQKQNPNINFIIENKPGSDEVVGFNHFAKQPADGHTLFVPAIGVFVGTKTWYSNILVHDPFDVEFVISLARTPLALVANSEKGVKTLEEFNQLSGAVNIGVGAAIQRVAYEYLRTNMKAQTEMIGYRSPALAAVDVAGGQVHYGIFPASSAYEFYKAGKVRYLGITGNTVPSKIQGTMLLKFSLVGQVGVVLPRNTDPTIVKFWEKTFLNALRTAEFTEFLNDIMWYTLPEDQNSTGYEKLMIEQRKLWAPYVDKIKLH